MAMYLQWLLRRTHITKKTKKNPHYVMQRNKNFYFTLEILHTHAINVTGQNSDYFLRLLLTRIYNLKNYMWLIKLKICLNSNLKSEDFNVYNFNSPIIEELKKFFVTFVCSQLSWMQICFCMELFELQKGERKCLIFLLSCELQLNGDRNWYWIENKLAKQNLTKEDSWNILKQIHSFEMKFFFRH